MLPGDPWEGDIINERNTRGLIAQVTAVSQVTDVLFAANNPGDTVGVYIDGALFEVTAGANAGATALLFETRIEAAALLASVVSTVTVDTATATITFADDQVHTVVEYSPDATTATPSEVTAAVGQQQLLFGYGVVRQVAGDSGNFTKVVKPTAVTDMFAGVLLRTTGSDMPPDQITALGFDPDYLCPGCAYTVITRNFGIVVEYAGNAPVETDPVYLVCSGADAGKWDVVDGSVAGTSEVVTLTLTSVADGLIGFSYDGLPALTVTATAVDATDAASLYALWVGNAAYAANGSIVDNLDGTLEITFADDTTHTFADESTGTSTVAEAVDTPAVAAIAATNQLISYASWGRPSVTEGNTPSAFLRLNNP